MDDFKIWKQSKQKGDVGRIEQNMEEYANEHGIYISWYNPPFSKLETIAEQIYGDFFWYLNDDPIWHEIRNQSECYRLKKKLSLKKTEETVMKCLKEYFNTGQDVNRIICEYICSFRFDSFDD